MKLKGLMLLLVAIFAMGVLVAGCGGDDGNDEPDTSIDTTDGVSSEELEDAASEAEQSITEALDDPQALEECRQGAEALSGDAEEQALDACEQVFGGE
jgi:hypothetical protein